MTDLEHGDGHVRTQDGMRLYWQRWLPEEPKGVVLFLHGTWDHSGRYADLAEHLCGRGIGLYGLDYRGHGRSEGQRIHIDSYQQYLDDAALGRQHVAKGHPKLPLFMMGHSQGATIALLSALDEPEGLAAVVGTSPFLGIHPESMPSALLDAASKVLNKLLPTFALDNGLDTSVISLDQAVVEAFAKDPLVSSKATSRWLWESRGAHERALAGAARMTVPTLITFAGADRLVDAGATRRWVEAAPDELVESKEWEGLAHEIMKEPERGEVFDHLASWLEKRLEAS